MHLLQVFIIVLQNYNSLKLLVILQREPERNSENIILYYTPTYDPMCAALYNTNNINT